MRTRIIKKYTIRKMLKDFEISPDYFDKLEEVMLEHVKESAQRCRSNHRNRLMRQDA
jgi:hypothetical protein